MSVTNVATNQKVLSNGANLKIFEKLIVNLIHSVMLVYNNYMSDYC